MTIQELQNKLKALPPEAELRYSPRGIPYSVDVTLTPHPKKDSIVFMNILTKINRE